MVNVFVFVFAVFVLFLSIEVKSIKFKKNQIFECFAKNLSIAKVKPRRKELLVK